MIKLKLLDQLQEEGFAVLRGPFESGRQSPNSLGGMLTFSILLQLLMFVLTYVVAADSTYFPYADIVFVIHSMVTATLILLSIIYSFPKVYMSRQKTQYFIVILVSQNLFGLFSFTGALFFLGKELSINSLLLLTITTLIFGILIVIIFYTMLFVLPEQLVILYCKYRFESFNFDKDGNLKPMGTKRKDVIY
ncbi:MULTISPECIES: hypothetical protein [unclassified Virgibacillus]|uniref:hypothetical protein n=1 Tax=unclassified Virgibacillus TaxID=2620237 RepID=UPI000AED4337|nr:MULTISPECIES: hypothetical protein [unclassified Virgibacillus]